MGEEITNTRFKKNAFDLFHSRLKQETELLASWFEHNNLDNKHYVAGFELETWLLDQNYQPAPVNETYLQRINNPLVSPELSKFNVELNANPQLLNHHAICKLHKELEITWNQCISVAKDMDILLAMIGILPTVREDDLTLQSMSEMKRYHALNEQVLRMRKGKPITLDITGPQPLKTEHKDVMLESATTSLQVHMQIPIEQSVRYYNAAQIISAPLIALSANSPFLFGHQLWDETRIPLFEQAVAVGGFDGAMFGPTRRVSFGSGYARHSLMECFNENLAHFPILLPVTYDDDIALLKHLRLHNGTIWRWNRPLIGFDNGNPHIRIEQRVMPAGPSIIDTVANMAFFYGLIHYLASEPAAPELTLPFSHTRDNFYLAAKKGLSASLIWLDGNKHNAKHLLLNKLLPMAKSGLEMLEISTDDIGVYLDIIEARLINNCNGANWQKAFVKKYGHDMTALTKAYIENQKSSEPVHRWNL